MIKIRKIGILSLAKIYAVAMGLFGLLAGVFFALMGIIVGSASDNSGSALGFGIFGVFSIIIFPIIYAGMGFVAGAIGAFVYNIAAKFVGGIEVEFDSQTKTEA